MGRLIAELLVTRLRGTSAIVEAKRMNELMSLLHSMVQGCRDSFGISVVNHV